MSVFRQLAAAVARQGMARVLAVRDYRIFVLTDWASNIGNWAYRVALGWLAWELTHSGFWLGFVSLVGALPSLTILPLAGAYADRVDRLKLLKATQVIGALVGALLWGLTWAGWIEIYSLSALAFALGVTQTFAQPARMTIPPNLVPRYELTAAIGLAASGHASARFIGPALGGLMIAGSGAAAVFLFNALSYLAFLWGLAAIRLNAEEHQRDPQRGLIADMMEGLRYTFTHAQIGPLMILVILSSILTRAFLELFPGFNDAVFHAGAEELGYLMAAVGVGGFAGSLWVANFVGARGLVNKSYGFIAATAVLVLAYAATERYEVAVATVAVLGFCITAWQSTTTVLFQGSVDGVMRGRVMSIYSLTYRSCSSLSAMIAGAASTWLGLQIPVAIGAAAALVILAAYLPKRRGFIDAFETPLAHPAPPPVKAAE